MVPTRGWQDNFKRQTPYKEQKLETRPVCNHCWRSHYSSQCRKRPGYASDVARRATGLEIARRVGKRIRPGRRVFAMVTVNRSIGLEIVQKIGK